MHAARLHHIYIDARAKACIAAAIRQLVVDSSTLVGMSSDRDYRPGRSRSHSIVGERQDKFPGSRQPLTRSQSNARTIGYLASPERGSAAGSRVPGTGSRTPGTGPRSLSQDSTGRRYPPPSRRESQTGSWRSSHGREWTELSNPRSRSISRKYTSSRSQMPPPEMPMEPPPMRHQHEQIHHHYHHQPEPPARKPSGSWISRDHNGNPQLERVKTKSSRLEAVAKYMVGDYY